MESSELFRLYLKERDYQQKIFGSYKDNSKFNIASFLQFIEHYLDKCKESYVDIWTDELPLWLESCKESSSGTSPAKTYEQLIKLFVLAGAALESYCNVNTDEWRKEINPKWKEIIE